MGIQRPPDKIAVLADTWRAAIRASGDPKTLVIGGKSMGGRVATLVADEMGVKGVVCLGFPFHAPGHPEMARVESLQAIRTPTLIVQGTEDPFGIPSAVKGFDMAPTVGLKWIRGGDHSYQKRTAIEQREHEKNWDLAIKEVTTFVNGL